MSIKIARRDDLLSEYDFDDAMGWYFTCPHGLYRLLIWDERLPAEALELDLVAIAQGFRDDPRCECDPMSLFANDPMALIPHRENVPITA